VAVAGLCRQHGLHNEAILILEGLTDEERTDQRVLRELGASAFAAGSYEAASRAYDAALENINLAAAKRGDIDDLIRLYEGTAEAARENGNQFRATILYSNLADYLSNNGYRDRASDVRAVADANARASEERRAIRVAEPAVRPSDLSARAAERSAKIDGLLAKAHQSFAANRPYAATEYFNDLRKKYPGYSYKEATLNPTNPRDRANDWEADIINGFRDDSSKSETVTIRDTPIPQDATVLLLLGSANHDERKFTGAETLDLARPATRSVAFGAGVHFCIGAPLARFMFGVMVKAVPQRLPDYEINLDGVRRYTGNPTMDGVGELPVTFTAGRPLRTPRPQ